MKRELDIRVIRVANPLRDLAPQPAQFHDVGLVDLADPAVALSRQIEGGADDAFDLGLGIDFGVDPAPAAVRQCLDPARLAEIDAAGQFPHDHQIEAGNDLTLQAGGVGERIEHHRRAQIGEQVHFLAQPKDAALGTQLERQGVPFRAADGAEQHRVAGDRLGQGLVAQRNPRFIQSRAAHETLGDFEAG